MKVEKRFQDLEAMLNRSYPHLSIVDDDARTDKGSSYI
jgi:hypothetical protein